MIEAKIVCDSVGPNGVRLTTFVLTYPRFIHSEFMTHRMISRNASSSRAIPVKKQIQMVIDNPAIPLAFTKNKAGMQGGDPLNEADSKAAREQWLLGRDHAVETAGGLAQLEVHKQYANRVLEPYAHITVVATATEWSNFFALRCHEAAQPEIHALADVMYDSYKTSVPKKLEEGEWHLPFVEESVKSEFCTKTLSEERTKESHTINISMFYKTENDDPIKCSVARCARVSYLNHEGKKPTLEEDLALYNRLVGSAPIHASPAEHQAMATDEEDLQSGNFRGWRQYRKTLENENVENFEK